MIAGIYVERGLVPGSLVAECLRELHDRVARRRDIIKIAHSTSSFADAINQPVAADSRGTARLSTSLSADGRFRRLQNKLALAPLEEVDALRQYFAISLDLGRLQMEKVGL